MACFTMVTVEVQRDRWTRKAAKKFGLERALEKGTLTQLQAREIEKEAGILRGISEVQTLAPGALIVRKGDVVTVTVEA